MKKYLLLFAVCIANITASAQIEEADTVLSADMDRVLNACVKLSDAVANNDTLAAINAEDSLSRLRTKEFTRLFCCDTNITKLEGHLRFFEDFPVITGATRGQTENNTISTKTCYVRAGMSTVYTFKSTGHQELAVAAEADGKVTLKIHVTNNAGFNKRYDDIKDVKQGRNFRKAVFDLPKGTRCNVTLEVFNCGKKDISFVVISN